MGVAEQAASMHINYEVSDRSIGTCCNSRVETKKARTLHDFRVVTAMASVRAC